MRVATIVPVEHVDLVEGDAYKMALAHLADRPAYAEAYTRRQGVDSTHVILDNGVIETGEPVYHAGLLDVAERLRVTEVVVPDDPRSAMKTLALAREFMIEVVYRYADPVERTLEGPRRMIVPHGKTLDEWVMCFHHLTQVVDPHTVGISKLERHSHRLVMVEAVVMANGIRAEWGYRPLSIHLLGMEETFAEWSAPRARAAARQVRGIDSGLASFYTAAERTMDEYSLRPPSVSLTAPMADRNLLEFNVGVWRGLASSLGRRVIPPQPGHGGASHGAAAPQGQSVSFRPGGIS